MQRDIKVQLQQGHGLLQRGEKVMQRACPYLDIGLKAKKAGSLKRNSQRRMKEQLVRQRGEDEDESPGKALCQMSFRSHI